MSKKHNTLPTIAALIFFCFWGLLFLFLLLVLLPMPQMTPQFRIESPKMISCVTNQVQACGTPAITALQTSRANNICIAWKEVNRKPSDSLAIYIYDSNNNRVFSYTESNSNNLREYSQCKVLPVRQINKVGKYRLEFVATGRLSNGPVYWEITR